MYLRSNILLLFVSSLIISNAVAQNCVSIDVNTTNSSMSVFFSVEASQRLIDLGLENDTIAVLYDSLCVGKANIENGFFAFSIWGNDETSYALDGINPGQFPTNWIIKDEDKFHEIDIVIEDNQFISGFQDDLIIDVTDIIYLGYNHYGCTDDNFIEYYNQGYFASCDDGSCSTISILGCTNQIADNFNASANIDDGSCIIPNTCNNFNVISTDQNLSLLVMPSAVDRLLEYVNIGDTLGVFYNELCVGNKIIEEEFFAFSIFGNDESSLDLDGLLPGQNPTHWVIKTTGNEIYSIIPVFQKEINLMGGKSDLIVEIIDFNFQESYYAGCTDPSYIEYWQQNYVAGCDDGSCQESISPLLQTNLNLLDSIVIIIENLTNENFQAIDSIGELNTTISEVQSENSYLINQASADSLTIDSISSYINQIEDYVQNISQPIYVEAPDGWFMVGYNYNEFQDLTESTSHITQYIIILKDFLGSAYLPEFNFNGIGDLTPGYGYQVKFDEPIPNFYFLKLD